MTRLGALFATMLVANAAIAQDPIAETETYFPQQLSARELLLYCASGSLTDRGRQRQRYCSGFVSGVEEAIRLAMRMDPRGLGSICPPPTERARQFTDNYIRYAGRRGADLDRPAAQVVVEALRDAYPCPQ